MRRAILGMLVFLAGPSGTTWLVVHHRPAGALAAGGFTVLYGVAELIAFELRDRRKAAAHLRYEREAAEPILGTYCPQVEDRYYEQVELKNGRWAV